jgi:hypothetical protein
MNQYQITATHPACGEVRFTFLAKTREEAFSTFKNIVFNHKQWIVSDNSLLAGTEHNAGDRGGPSRHAHDCRCFECEL